MIRKAGITGCILLFFLVPVLSGMLVWGARAIHAPALPENPEVFRKFSIAPERLYKARKETGGYGNMTEDFLFCQGELGQEPEERTSLWFSLFLRDEVTEEYEAAFRTLLEDAECFPVGKIFPAGASAPEGEETKSDSEIRFEDSWGGARSFGGERRHEGTDLMPPTQERGYYPVVSVSDGEVEKIGWLRLGGYRVGIRAEHGAYFYYAHLDHYEDGMEKGKKVKAGDVLGYMGDSGYGPEGTVGKFQVHLHFGMYLTEQGQEISVNPYTFLQYLNRYGTHKIFYQ